MLGLRCTCASTLGQGIRTLRHLKFWGGQFVRYPGFRRGHSLPALSAWAEIALFSGTSGIIFAIVSEDLPELLFLTPSWVVGALAGLLQQIIGILFSTKGLSKYLCADKER